MVAHHPKITLWNGLFRNGATVLIALGHVWLIDALAIHIDSTVGDFQIIAGERNDALDVALRWIARVVEYHHIAPMNLFEPVDKLVDEEAIVVVQARLHAGALDPYRLVDASDDERGNPYGHCQVAQPGLEVRAECGLLLFELWHEVVFLSL